MLVVDHYCAKFRGLSLRSDILFPKLNLGLVELITDKACSILKDVYLIYKFNASEIVHSGL